MHSTAKVKIFACILEVYPTEISLHSSNLQSSLAEELTNTQINKKISPQNINKS